MAGQVGVLPVPVILAAVDGDENSLVAVAAAPARSAPPCSDAQDRCGPCEQRISLPPAPQEGGQLRTG